MVGSLPPGASETYISLNEVVQNGRERLETTQSTERYFSPDDIGRQQPKEKTTHEVRNVQFSPPREADTFDLHEESRPIRREETFQSTTTTLVESSRTSIAEGNVGHSVPTVDIGDGVAEDSDHDLYARLSPILGECISSTTFDRQGCMSGGGSVENNT